MRAKAWGGDLADSDGGMVQSLLGSQVHRTRGGAHSPCFIVVLKIGL